MSDYRVVPIPATVSERVRATLRAPGYGHPAHVEPAAGYGPCRSCLRTFREGEEERILFTFDPFHGLDPYPQPGPVFIHREACAPHDGIGFAAGLRSLPLTLEAFGEARWMVRREHIDGRDPEPLIAELLALPGVRYLHLRNREAGCYIARVERIELAASAA